MTPGTLPPSRTDPRVRGRRRGSPVAVEVLICGSTDRGDDGAPLLAATHLGSVLPADVRVRSIGRLDVDDLLSVPTGAGVVIVDAATGIAPGTVVELPLSGLIGHEDRLRPRSSHAIAVPEVVGVADMIRGHPLRGRIVAIGTADFRLGRSVSSTVTRAIPSLVTAIVAAVDHVRPAPAGDAAAGKA